MHSFVLPTQTLELFFSDKVDKSMKPDFLSRIIDQKKQEVENARKLIPESRLVEAARTSRDHRPFFARLSIPGPFGANIIAEVKRASPSRGDIRIDLDAAGLAQAYERAGAAAISVLTEQAFFRARPTDLQTVRSAVSVPVLRKDFIISPYQVYETAVMGADAVLLIARALSHETLKDLLELCRELHLDALVEVHSAEEMEEATMAGARLIGINNRDLSSFQTDLQTSVRLAGQLQESQIAVAESGINERRQVEMLIEAGIWNFLIGESLVRAPDPGTLLKDFLGVHC
jgi:indole-3-glycerol phosphate synthase